jgi:hypothetical protein
VLVGWFWTVDVIPFFVALRRKRKGRRKIQICCIHEEAISQGQNGHFLSFLIVSRFFFPLSRLVSCDHHIIRVIVWGGRLAGTIFLTWNVSSVRIMMSGRHHMGKGVDFDELKGMMCIVYK